LKYTACKILFNEVPGEISLGFFISGCRNYCVGCHSPHLQRDIGDVLTESVLKELLDTIGKLCTCVLFMGGERYSDELRKLTELAHSEGYKVAMYSGAEDIKFGVKYRMDYFKVGPYIEELGPLTSQTTNQRMYKNVCGDLEDITYKFWESR
jgi:anaerobic ribonucleoside-triphosphate reductase activating protein